MNLLDVGSFVIDILCPSTRGTAGSGRVLCLVGTPGGGMRSTLGKRVKKSRSTQLLLHLSSHLEFHKGLGASSPIAL